MSKFVGFIVGAMLIVAGVLTGNVGLIIQGSAMIVTQAIVDLTAPKTPAREASEMSIALGEQPRVLLVGETFTPGSLVDGFNYGGKYGTDWECLVIRLADHKCHSLTGFFVNDEYNPYTGDGLVTRYDDQLEIYFRSDTTNQPLPAVVTAHGPGWTSADIGESGCDIVVCYKADKPNDKHPGWPGGRPRFGFVVKGKLQYDPRLDSTVTGGSGPHRWDDPSTWEWSENAVICRYNWVRGVYANDDVTDPTKLLVGRGLTAEEAPPENIFADANLCDEVQGAAYPVRWTATPVAFNPTSFSPDGTMLYTVSSGKFAGIYLPTRTLLFSVDALSAGAGGVATDDGVYWLDGSGNLFFGGRTGGSVGQIVAQSAMGFFPGGIGAAGGDVWVLPHSFSPNHIGQYSSGFTKYDVNYSPSHVFTRMDGAAMAVGTTSGNVLAIGVAGADGTLISTSAYGTSGVAYAFDNGTNYVAWQGSRLFLISKGGTPAIIASVNCGALLRVAEAFAAVKAGAATFWIDGKEYNSSDLSVVRTPDTSGFTASMGGTPGGGYVYDSINHALMVTTSGAFGMGFLLLDRHGGYRVAGPIYANQQFLEVEEMFAAACAGSVITREGSVELEPGHAKSVVATFTDDDLVSGTKVSWNEGFLSESNQEWVNTIVARYVEPDQKWNDHAAPVVRNTANIIADGRPREAQLTLRLVRYQAQALRVAEVARRLGRLWGRATVTLGPRFCEVEDGDWVQWTSARRFGGATKTFRVESYSIDARWRNTLTLREINGDAFAADGVFANDYSQPITSPPPPDIGTPDSGNWTLTAITLDSPGFSAPALHISGSASDDAYAEAIVFEYWQDDGVTAPTVDPDSVPWISAGSEPPDATEKNITSIIGGATYYAAVSYVVDGIPGDRLVLGPVTVSGYALSDLHTFDVTTTRFDSTTHTWDAA